MPTTLTIRTRNQVDFSTDVSYASQPGEFIEMNLDDDYFIWTAGDDVVKDHMSNEPTEPQLNNAAPIIDDREVGAEDVMVALCLLFDESGGVQGAYKTHKVLGMGIDRQFVYCFSFIGATGTAMIPRLEAWDDNSHTTIAKHVLGNNEPEKSMVKAIMTTNSAPQADWVKTTGIAIAGIANYIPLDTAPLTGSKDLYCNLGILIPAKYSTPSVDPFVLTVRFTYF